MPCATPEKPLSGCQLIYTRNRAHWRQFAPLVHHLGAIPWHLPLMDTQRETLDARALRSCKQADALVFVSANAVTHLLTQYRPTNRQMLVCLGEKTAATLRNAAYPASLVAPPPHDSEALLKIWRPRGLRIALICAPGGRSLLGQALLGDNGIARVVSYRRYNPSKTWPYNERAFDAIVLSSVQTLRHLTEITPQNVLKLLEYRLLVAAMSPRIASAAAQAGFVHCISSEFADERQLIEALCAWWLSTKGTSNE